MGIFKFLDGIVRDVQAVALKKYPEYYREGLSAGTYRINRMIKNNWDEMVNLTGSLYSENGVRNVAFIMAYIDRGGERLFDYNSWLNKTAPFFEELVRLGVINNTPLQKKRNEEDEKRRKAEEDKKIKKAQQKKQQKIAQEKVKKEAEENKKRDNFSQYLKAVESNILFSHKVYKKYFDNIREFSKDQRKLFEERYAVYLKSTLSLGFIGDDDNSASNYMWLIKKQKKQSGAVIMTLIYTKHFNSKTIESFICNAGSEREESQWIKVRDKINELLNTIEIIIKDNVSVLMDAECLPIPFASDAANKNKNL